MYFSTPKIHCTLKTYSPYLRLLEDDATYFMNVVSKGASNFAHLSTVQQSGTINGVACWEILISYKIPSGNPGSQFDIFAIDDLEITDAFTSPDRTVVVKTFFYASNNTLLFDQQNKTKYSEAEPIR